MQHSMYGEQIEEVMIKNIISTQMIRFGIMNDSGVFLYQRYGILYIVEGNMNGQLEYSGS